MDIKVDIVKAFRVSLINLYSGMLATAAMYNNVSVMVHCQEEIRLLSENKLIPISIKNIQNAKDMLIFLKPDITEAEISYVLNSVLE